MAKDQASEAKFTNLTVTRGDGTPVEIEIGWNKGEAKAAIIFSHGANAAPERYRALTQHWVKSGFIVISPLHVDSERHPQREVKDRGKLLTSRLADMEFLTNALDKSDVLPKNISAQMTGKPLIAAGHSFGAYIAQIAGGATVLDPANGKAISIAPNTDIAGILALTPPPALDGFSPKGSWVGVTKPMLVQTGTLDVLPYLADRWEQHLDSFNEAKSINKWKVVYDGVDHYFGGVIGRVSETPDAKAKAKFDRFAVLSLKFMDYAIGARQARFDFAAEVEENGDAQ